MTLKLRDIVAPLWTPPRFRVSHVGELRSGRTPGTVETVMTMVKFNARGLPVNEHVLTMEWYVKAIQAQNAEFGMALTEFARTHPEVIRAACQ